MTEVDDHDTSNNSCKHNFKRWEEWFSPVDSTRRQVTLINFCRRLEVNSSSWNFEEQNLRADTVAHTAKYLPFLENHYVLLRLGRVLDGDTERHIYSS